ncbi:ABC transporter permease [Heyndrickxia oleronia]|uniref:YhgE/Pip domain-containing protein n=1 Tax=Heyndrickxia oleronia TaxID=38875 RepID=UPI00203E0A0B|nr:ABC transporter permease [Heyndrickxia oleronia]MCM3240533.1 ABC transporter permease [Heyndrickxia oleronia]
MTMMKQFFKQSETFVGLGAAFFFLLIFFCVWMTAYDGVNDRIDQLKIGFVNEDKQMGSVIEKEMEKSIPFDIKIYQTIKSAQKDMNQRKLDMVMQIPEGFSSEIQEKGKSDLKYFINQANASLAKQLMEVAAKTITQSVNENVYMYKQQLILSKVPEQMTTVISSKELAQSLTKNIESMLQSLSIQSVQPSVEKTNHVDGFAATMVPMMIVLASFVGSMIMSLNVHMASIKLKPSFSKWRILLARIVINASVALLLTVISLVLMAAFNIELQRTLIETGVFQLLVYFSFLSLTQMFVVLFGPGGMLFNILVLSLQLVTSGVIVPKVMLSNFYQSVGSVLPATYAADGYYTVIFGGENLALNMMILLLISLVSVVIVIIKAAFQKSSAGVLREKVSVSQ